MAIQASNGHRRCAIGRLPSPDQDSAIACLRVRLPGHKEAGAGQLDLGSARILLSLRAERSNLGPVGNIDRDCRVAPLLAMTVKPAIYPIGPDATGTHCRGRFSSSRW